MENPIGKLDIVLKWMVEHDKHFWKTEEIIKQVDYKPLLTEINIQLLHIILEKLVKDGNASLDESETKTSYTRGEIEINKVWLYKISFDGILFYEQGGYKENEKVKQLEYRYLEIDVRLKKRNEKLIVWGTWIAAVGVLIAAVYYIQEMGKYLSWW